MGMGWKRRQRDHGNAFFAAYNSPREEPLYATANPEHYGVDAISFRRERAFDKLLALGNLLGVPQRSVLVLQKDQVAVGVCPRGSS